MTNMGICIDIETTGLDAKKDVMLELSAIVFNRDTFDELGTFSQIIPNSITNAYMQYLADSAEYSKTQKPSDEPWANLRYVYEMHTKSGLAQELSEKYDQGYIQSNEDVERLFIDWMASFGIGKGHISLPVTGSSVHFDRKFLDKHMPLINENLHYRNLDVSTIKVVVDQWMPTVKEIRRITTTPKGLHRGLNDCRDTLAELKFYFDYIIKPIEGMYKSSQSQNASING